MSRDPFDIAVGDRLKSVREKARLTQAEFAARIDISPRAYENYERGERPFPGRGIHAVYDMFGVDPVWLLSGLQVAPRGSKGSTRQELLAEIIIKVERHLATARLTLPVEKKARLIVLLNQYVQLKGKVEDDHIEHVLSVSAL